MPLSVFDVYHHLDPRTVQRSIDYVPVDLQTEQDLLLLKNLNDDADLLLPVTSTGHRMNDVDSIKSISNPVARDLLISRLQPLGVEDTSINEGLTDEEIANNVVDKDMTYSNIVDHVHELNDYINEGIKIDEDNNPPVDVPSIVEPNEPVE